MISLVVALSSVFVWALFSVKFHCTREPTRVIGPNYRTLYLGMYDEKLNSSHYTILTYLVRRIIYASTVVHLSDWPSTQIFILIITSSLYGIFMSHMQPYITAKHQNLQTFNELAFTASCIMMLAFTTALNTTVEDRKVAGLSICLIALAAIILNIAVMLHSTYQQLDHLRRKRSNYIKWITNANDLSLIQDSSVKPLRKPKLRRIVREDPIFERNNFVLRGNEQMPPISEKADEESNKFSVKAEAV